MEYSMVQHWTEQGVGVIQLDRPKALNALHSTLMQEVGELVSQYDRDPQIGCIVLTGSEKAFAAGADIGEMKDKSFVEVYHSGFPAIDRDGWRIIAEARTPVIAAVAGFALGGGCELAMSCDFIIAAENAKFGQPEIKLGTIPGAGGTQRLTRAIGRARAMEMCLTGRMMDAQEAYQAGLVVRIVPVDQLQQSTLETAVQIANFSRPAVQMIKESVNLAEDMALAEGLAFEQRNFSATFATEDQKEGMSAFLEKRQAVFKHR